MEKIVIIGGVAAGATAAAKVRRLSPNAEITLLESGPDISFANCGLPYFIGGDIKSRSKLILQSPDSFNDQYSVAVHINTEATAINRQSQVVSTINRKNGEKKEFEYTKLILAQGGRPITPPLPGADLDHVFSLWTLEDMDRINAHLTQKEPKNVVVVGGGFIGLEMVEAFAKRGLNVSVVEMMPHVMAIMETEIAGFIEEEMASHGVNIHTGTGVTKIESDSVTLSDGTVIDAELVLLSIGVRPTLKLAVDADLKLGDAGGLLVDKTLVTSDPNIFAAGDMVEIEHRVASADGKGMKVRIPLAGPANRQGRIAAENALGGNHVYKGALGTSVVRVFEAVAGTTGLSLKQARTLGIDADAVVVHKEHHTSYFPGATQVTVMVVYDKATGTVLGGQTAGYKGADKRLDVIATAAAAKLTVSDLADIDFAYSPPIGTANDAMNMVAYTAENRMSGYSPSITVSELDSFLLEKSAGKKVTFVDVRDIFSFNKSHIKGAVHIPLELFFEKMSEIPKDGITLVYDGTGKKGHQALRTLMGEGYTDVYNISGGFSSLQRYARAVDFEQINLPLLELEKKSILDDSAELEEEEIVVEAVKSNEPLVVDVRTPEEFSTGAFPGAINIPLDEITTRTSELGEKDREIILYCASGGRSAYAAQQLAQDGFSNLENGGGISHMMDRVLDAKSESTPLVVDVRSPQEFSTGGYPDAINIPVDSLGTRQAELGDKDRHITLYCASGARSGYGQMILTNLGFTTVENGGALMHMMARKE
jgi:NADPH-dependent 2,4-dienoyl-CoA reductase/sulfur reductase-like enzyme/rhodanese-related sulfurtransferase